MPTGDGAAAVLHLLEAERVAAESVHVTVKACRLLLHLLPRNRRAATSGLTPWRDALGLLI